MKAWLLEFPFLTLNIKYKYYKAKILAFYFFFFKLNITIVIFILDPKFYFILYQIILLNFILEHSAKHSLHSCLRPSRPSLSVVLRRLADPFGEKNFFVNRFKVWSDIFLNFFIFFSNVFLLHFIFKKNIF